MGSKIPKMTFSPRILPSPLNYYTLQNNLLLKSNDQKKKSMLKKEVSVRKQKSKIQVMKSAKKPEK